MNLAIARDSQAYFQEWVQGSGVHPGIYHLNVYELSGQRAMEALTEDAIAKAQKVTSYATTEAARILARHENAREGGWAVSGLDPLDNWQPMDWFQMKPDVPRRDNRRDDKEKLIKYEAPEGVPTRAFFLRVPFEVSFRTALIYGETDEQIKEDWLRRFQQEAESVLTGHGKGWSQADIERLHALFGAVQRGEYQEIDQLFREHWDSQGCSDRQLAGTHQQGIRCLDLLEDRQYWRYVHERNLSTIITEGAKKGAALLSCGYPAIALPGISGGVRTKDANGNRIRPYLIPEIQYFATLGRQFYTCFDYETKEKTKQAVAWEVEKLSGLLTNATRQIGDRGQTVLTPLKVVRLPGPQKGVDDFLVAQGADAATQVFQQAKSLQDWETWQNSRLSYVPTLELNQRYLGSLPIPETAKLIGVRSPKGTGKTEALKEIVQRANDAGKRVLILTHRVQLGQAICDRVGLPFVNELRNSEEGDLFGYGLCIDSLHSESQARFNADYWHDAVVILDESEQLISHLLFASTEVSNKRIEIVGELRQLARNASQIILLDADLTDLSINYFQELAELQAAPWIVVNNHKPIEPWEVYHYNQNQPGQMVQILLQYIQDGGKPFIVTHGQKTKSRWSTRTLEALVNRQCPDLKVLRIDSQTIGDRSHPAYRCISHLNEVVAEYDTVICSPCIETGVSIDDLPSCPFTSVWGILQGVTTTESARQSLARVRRSVPRHIWISKKGLSRIGNGSASYKALQRDQQRQAQTNLWLLQLEKALLERNKPAQKACLLSLEYWAQFATRINAGMADYRGTVLQGLLEEGHELIEVGALPENQYLKDLITEIRNSQHEAECEAIASAGPVTASDYKKLQSQKEKTQQECYEERRYSIEDKYRIPITPNLVAKDDDKWFYKLRLYYYLIIGKQFLKARDSQSYEAEYRQGQVWLPTFNRSQLGPQIAILEKLGIKALFNPDRDYRQTDPELQHLKAIAQTYSREIQSFFRLTIPQDRPETNEHEAKPASAIQIAQMFLQKLGMKLTYDRREGPRGDRQRVYRFIPPQDGRHEVFAAWFERDELAAAKAEAIAAAAGSVSTPPINNYLNQSWTQQGVAV